MGKNLNTNELDNLLEEKPINWREIIEKYLGYWQWIVVAIVVMLTVGVLYYRIQYDNFELKATLLITDNSSSGQVSQMSVLKQLDAFGVSAGSSNIYNENKVIHSKELIKKVVNELNLYYQYSTVSFLKPIELYDASPVQVSMNYDDLLRLVKPLELKIELNDNEYKISGKYTIPNQFGQEKFSKRVKSLPATINTAIGDIQIWSKTEFEDDIMVKINNPLSVTKSYQDNYLSSEVDEDGDIIYLTCKTNNSQKGKDIVAKLIELYNQDAIDQINKSANYTALFIDSRLELLKQELSGVEKDIQTFKQSNKLTDIETDAQLILERSNLYDKNINEVEIQLQLIEFIENFVSDPANRYALIPNLGLTDVGLVSVIQEFNKLLINRERIASGSSETNPTLKTLELQLSSSRISIKNSIANSRRGLQISKKEIEDQNSLLLSQIKKIPQQQREFIEIKRQQQIKESLYLFLLQKREEASLSMAITVPKGRILDAADAATKVAPQLSKILMIFLALGLLLPTAFIYLKFTLTTTFNDRKEAETLTKVPIIAELAHQKNADVIIDHGTNASANAELLRLLRSKLQFIMNRPKDRLILITSTESGEGKTFVSINLAVSISLTGKKVLLIGMDLRKPMLAQHFGINQQEGISSYLSGIEPDYNKLLCQTPEFPDLHILPGGIIPPNPNELILSERFDQLIAELREQYDYIIIDSAPVGAVSDTFLINRVSNLTLYICRAKYSDKRNLEFLERINNENSLKQIYLVINDVDIESNRYGGKYAYGYGYGYGYGKKRTKRT